MSNLDKLKEAGIIDPERTLSQEQQEAIDDLSAEDVDRLISINDQLWGDLEEEDQLIVMPVGRSGKGSTSE